LKNILITLLLLLFTYTAIAQPTIDDVVKEYFTTYTNVEAPNLIRFSKRANGWYVSEINYQKPNEYKNDQVFWSNAEQQYLSLTFPKRTDADSAGASYEAASYLSYYITDFDRTQFRKSLYYGYPGWDWHVIQTLQNRQDLADTLLENLARAYSNYASGFLQDQYGLHFLNNDADRKIISDSAAISASRKNKYVLYERKAIETWSKLAQRNPDYATIVGKVAIKLANEGMAAWSTLRMAGYPKDADGFIKNVKYPDSLLEIARAYFPKTTNAIFISVGDNDTYPLWYLQQTGYRKDVVVLNYSLLGLGRMLTYLSTTYKGSLFKTKRSSFLKPEFAYAWHQPGDCKKPMNIRSFLTSFKKAQSYRSFPCNEVTEPINAAAAAKLYKGKTLLPAMKLRMPNSLFLADYIILDIIQTNLYNKAIYFSYPDAFMPVQPYLTEEGVGYRLMPVKR
jgi:hypothetical protein